MTEQKLHRRRFIETGALAAAGTAIAGQKTADGSTLKKVPAGKVGLILYTVRDHMETAEDTARTLARVKEIGYDTIELAGFGPLKPAEWAKLLDKNELNAVAAHTGWEALEQDTRRVVDENKALGIEHLVVSSMPGKFRSAEGYERFAKLGSEKGEELAQYGMTFSYHNHSFEFTHFNGKPGQQILVEASDPKYFNFEIDVYWVQHGGGDPAAWIRKIAGRAPTVHVKDMVILDGKQAFAEVGEGNLNWPGILEACQEAEAKYLLVEQDTCQRDSFESAAISLRNMKKWGLS
ncbi:MAG: sugar phosphate isomerase/epimerase [Planctomycetota bacterium]|nr:MAG: sugar phosphate isomerase/epimerase [Planctomycetota bacterium]